MSAIKVNNLSYNFNESSDTVLNKVNLNVDKGSRCLLVGANGAGKSTLLKILAGKRLVEGDVKVFDKDVFKQSIPGISYLGTEWAMNSVVRGDIRVSEFLDSVGGFRYKDRRDTLLNILDVDLDWRMHQISDGERRRVQLVSGLMIPWNLLLLDEVTVDLDVVVRTDLIKFLIDESNSRNATIIYATHIFDGLFDFPTHIIHLRLGQNVGPPIKWPLDEKSDLYAIVKDDPFQGSNLLKLAIHWLREDVIQRRQYEQSINRQRGPKFETTDSETFYSKFDYWIGKN